LVAGEGVAVEEALAAGLECRAAAKSGVRC